MSRTTSRNCVTTSQEFMLRSMNKQGPQRFESFDEIDKKNARSLIRRGLAKVVENAPLGWTDLGITNEGRALLRKLDENGKTKIAREMGECGDCELGHRRVYGQHIATQRKGMIPTTPCEAIIATKFGHGNGHEHYKGGPCRQWGVYVDGELLRTKRGVGRAFTSEAAALRAGRKAAPYKEVT